LVIFTKNKGGNSSKKSEKQGEIWVENAIWFALLAEEEKEKNLSSVEP